MPLRPICEPVELSPGRSVIAERIVSAADAPASGRLLHFHDVSELVLFGRVVGDFFADGKRFALRDGALIFVPSMRHHDFDLAPGPKDWVLVQIDPYLSERLAVQPGLARLSRAFCALPDEAVQVRLRFLVDWLIEALATDPTGDLPVRLADLVLTTAAAAPEAENAQTLEGSRRVDRLLPALRRLRADPANPPVLEEAAALCRLSTAYFSRRFKQSFGMNFTEYSRAYRLHLAGRRIVGSSRPLASIAYELGFSSPSHFTARFHERFGMTPSLYRRAARGRQAKG